MTEEERFARHVAPGADGCKIWTGATRGGYGMFRAGGKVVGAHRYAFGPVPPGTRVACCPSDKLCVERAHLGVRPD